MSTRRKQPAVNRSWLPMMPATSRPSPKALAAAEHDEDVAASLLAMREVWANDRYIATVARDYDDGSVSMISFHRIDRGAAVDWRHKQMIKNDIAGTDVWAFEAFPPEEHKTDQANQYWLWVMPAGFDPPFGLRGRYVEGPGEGQDVGQRQRAFEPGTRGDEDGALPAA